MLALKLRPRPRQIIGAQSATLAEVLRDEVNLAVWQRDLSAEVEGFVNALLAQARPVSEVLTLDISAQGEVQPFVLLGQQAALPSYSAFSADVLWLVQAFACLLEAKRVGLRLRSLQQPMCPRFHVDHVPVRLISTYAGCGSEWLEEGSMCRERLGDSAAEPQDVQLIQQLSAGDVALAKGEKWQGNQGAGLIHRSPTPPAGTTRLLLTLDWLA